MTIDPPRFAACRLQSGRMEISLKGEGGNRLANVGGEAFYESEYWGDTTGDFCDVRGDALGSYCVAKRAAKQRDFVGSMELVGKVMAPDKWAAQRKKDEQMQVMDADVARRMERLRGDGEGQIPGGGYSRSPSTERGVRLYQMGLFSGEGWERAPLRRNKFIPSVAHEKRMDILNELLFFTQFYGPASRMGIITGPRCLAGEIRARFKKLNRMLNRLQEAAAKYGISIIFSSKELGSPLVKAKAKRWCPEKKKHVRPYVLDGAGQRIRCVDAEGRQTYHPHIHFIYHLSRFLNAAEWAAWIEDMQRILKMKVPDHGAICEPREACKYVMKCDELMALRDADFAACFHALRRIRLVNTSGLLREQIRHHKKHGIKLRWQTGPDEVPRLVPNENWNQPEFTLEETAGEKTARAAASVKPRGGVQILAISQPMARGTPIFEPMVTCRGINVTHEMILSIKSVRALYDRYHERWRAGADGVWLAHGGTPAQVAEKARAAAGGEFLLTIPPYLPGVGAAKAPSDADGAFLVGEPPPGGDSSGLRPPENRDFSAKTVSVSQTAGRSVAEPCNFRPVGRENPPQTKDPVALANGAFLVGANVGDAAVCSPQNEAK